MTKAEIRRRVLAARDATTPEWRTATSGAIAARVAKHAAFAPARIVAVFASFRSEVDTLPLVAIAEEQGKTLAWPSVEEKRLRFYRATRFELESKGVAGKLGIKEVPADPARLVEPAKIDLWIVPGVAFDLQRQRIGYGAGYYDGALTGAPKIGIAFDLQIVDAIPADAWDVKMDAVVTETRIL